MANERFIIKDEGFGEKPIFSYVKRSNEKNNINNITNLFKLFCKDRNIPTSAIPTVDNTKPISTDIVNGTFVKKEPFVTIAPSLITICGVHIYKKDGHIHIDIHNVDADTRSFFYLTEKGLRAFNEYLLMKQIFLFESLSNHVLENMYDLGFHINNPDFDWYVQIELYLDRPASSVGFHQDCCEDMISPNNKATTTYIQLEFIDAEPSIPTEFTLTANHTPQYMNVDQGCKCPTPGYDRTNVDTDLHDRIVYLNKEYSDIHNNIIYFFTVQWIIFIILLSLDKKNIIIHSIMERDLITRTRHLHCRNTPLEYMYPTFDFTFYHNFEYMFENELLSNVISCSDQVKQYIRDILNLCTQLEIFNPTKDNYNFFYDFLNNIETTPSTTLATYLQINSNIIQGNDFIVFQYILDKIREKNDALSEHVVDCLYNTLEQQMLESNPTLIQKLKNVIDLYKGQYGIRDHLHRYLYYTFRPAEAVQEYTNELLKYKQKLHSVHPENKQVENYDTYAFVDQLFEHTTPFNRYRPCGDVRQWNGPNQSDADTIAFNSISQPMYVRQVEDTDLLHTLPPPSAKNRTFYRYYWQRTKGEYWTNDTPIYTDIRSPDPTPRSYSVRKITSDINSVNLYINTLSDEFTKAVTEHF